MLQEEPGQRHDQEYRSKERLATNKESKEYFIILKFLLRVVELYLRGIRQKSIIGSSVVSKHFLKEMNGTYKIPLNFEDTIFVRITPPSQNHTLECEEVHRNTRIHAQEARAVDLPKCGHLVPGATV